MFWRNCSPLSSTLQQEYRKIFNFSLLKQVIIIIYFCITSPDCKHELSLYCYRLVTTSTSCSLSSKVWDSLALTMLTNPALKSLSCSATCRRPIKGAAGRPLQPSDLWNNENSLFSPKITSRTSSSSSSYTESRIVNKVTSLPPSHTSSSSLSSSSSLASSSRLLSATPPAGQTKAARRGMSLWVKLFLLAIVAAFLFFVYQAMESNSINPFLSADKDVSSGSAA